MCLAETISERYTQGRITIRLERYLHLVVAGVQVVARRAAHLLVRPLAHLLGRPVVPVQAVAAHPLLHRGRVAPLVHLVQSFHQAHRPLLAVTALVRAVAHLHPAPLLTARHPQVDRVAAHPQATLAHPVRALIRALAVVILQVLRAVHLAARQVLTVHRLAVLQAHRALLQVQVVAAQAVQVLLTAPHQVAVRLVAVAQALAVVQAVCGESETYLY